MKTSRTYNSSLAAVLLSVLLQMGSLSAFSQADSLPVLRVWSYNTAHVMEKKKWESGIAQPFRYGWKDRVEIRSNLLEMPFFPNLGIKVAYAERWGFALASEHLLSYPTVFLNTVSTKGTGGLISPQYAPYPAIISVMNTLLASRPVGKASLVTGFVGFAFALREEKPDKNATIDLPLIYPRMAHYYEGSTVRVGGHFKGTLVKRLYYEEGMEAFFVIRPKNNFFFENTGALFWEATPWLRVKGGYSLSYGIYPYGTQWQLWPSFDLVFGSRRR